jgi:GTP cyclohydrolase II
MSAPPDRSSPPPALAALAADAVQVARERAAAELRAGRPILIEDDARGLLVAALDGAAPSLFSAFAGMDEAVLILSPHRARTLGLAAERAIATPLRSLDQAEAERLSAAPRHTPPDDWTPAEPAAAAAVALCKQALLLPVALAAPLAPGAEPPAHLLRLSLQDAVPAPATALPDLEIVATADVPLQGDLSARFVVFRGGAAPRDQVAVVIGEPDPAQPVLARVHSACLTGDLFGSLKCDCGDQLQTALERLADNGGGVLLYLDQEGRGIGIGNKMRAYALQQEGMDTLDADAVLGFSADERRFEYAAAMLLKLGYGKVMLLTNNPEKIGALTRAGVEVAGRRSMFGAVTAHNRGYLTAKALRADHALGPLLGEDPMRTGSKS